MLVHVCMYLGWYPLSDRLGTNLLLEWDKDLRTPGYMCVAVKKSVRNPSYDGLRELYAFFHDDVLYVFARFRSIARRSDICRAEDSGKNYLDQL